MELLWESAKLEQIMWSYFKVLFFMGLAIDVLSLWFGISVALVLFDHFSLLLFLKGQGVPVKWVYSGVPFYPELLYRRWKDSEKIDLASLDEKRFLRHRYIQKNVLLSFLALLVGLGGITIYEELQ